MRDALPKGVGEREWGERHDEQQAKRERETKTREELWDGEGGDGGQRLQLCLALFDYPPNASPLPSSHPLLSFALSTCSSCMQTETTTITTASSLVRTQLPVRLVVRRASCPTSPHFAALRLAASLRLLRLFLTSTAENFQFLVFSLF